MENGNGSVGLEDAPRVHLVGVGGMGMSGLARLLRSRGAVVTGSDLKGGESLVRLVEEGVRVFPNHRASQIDFDEGVVIASAAIPAGNPEIAAAEAQGLPVLKYAEALGILTKGRRLAAVAGCHGKTSTTAMLAFALRETGFDPSFLVGGWVPQLGGNAWAGSGDLFVAEACEYDRSFLQLAPEVAVITNVDLDHLDTYGNLDGIREGFREFASRVRPGGVLFAGERAASLLGKVPGVEVRTVGNGPRADVRTAITRERGGRYAFRVWIRGLRSVHGSLQVPGRFQVTNAACAIAAAVRLGATPGAAAQAIARFEGVERRFQRLGDFGGVSVVDDYAHHPTEVRATIEASRLAHRGRRHLVVFQPHQHSRTRLLLDDFAESFAGADFVVLGEIYAARDGEEDRRSVSSGVLASRIRARGVPVEVRADFYSIAALVEGEARPGDVVLTLGAGNIHEVARELTRRLSLRVPGADGGRPVHHAPRRRPSPVLARA